MQDILSAMNWRIATKKYDTSKKVSAADLETLLEAARLSPSSFGLPTWKMIVVKNPEIRAKLREHAWGQSQLTDASDIVVFAVETKIDEASIDAYMELTAQTRGIPVESLAGFKGAISGAIMGLPMEARVAWATKQAYIALGVMLESAAILGVDATPMEGFSGAKFDEILGLGEKGLKSVVMCALGYRAADDSYASYAKVRLNTADAIIEIA
jgi:nitroreductase